MRISLAITLVFAMSACSTGEKATSTTDSTANSTDTAFASPTLAPVPQVTGTDPAPDTPASDESFSDSTFYLSGLKAEDTLYNILARNHLVGAIQPHDVRVDVATKSAMDIQNPAGTINYIAALFTISVPDSQFQALAFFNASDGMKVVASIMLDEPGDENNVRFEIGYTEQLIKGAGSFVAILERAEVDSDEFGTHTTGTDETIYWYALSGNEIIELTTFLAESRHHRTEDLYGFDDHSTTEYEFKTVNNRKLPDIILTTKTSTGIVDGSEESESKVILIFDGKGYQERSNQ